MRDAGAAEAELLEYARAQGKRGRGVRIHECEHLIAACDNEREAISRAVAENKAYLNEKLAVEERKLPWLRNKKSR